LTVFYFRSPPWLCAVLKDWKGRGLAAFPVVLARGKHLFPFRTEQLSPSAPMVLGPQGPGRVGRRRFFYEQAHRAPRRGALESRGWVRGPRRGARAVAGTCHGGDAHRRRARRLARASMRPSEARARSRGPTPRQGNPQRLPLPARPPRTSVGSGGRAGSQRGRLAAAAHGGSLAQSHSLRARACVWPLSRGAVVELVVASRQDERADRGECGECESGEGPCNRGGEHTFVQ
jgi:hypothetical protein